MTYSLLISASHRCHFSVKGSRPPSLPTARSGGSLSMRTTWIRAGVLVVGFVVLAMASAMRAGQQQPIDFGTFVESQLKAHSEQLFGIDRPLDESALGPFDGPDNLQAIQVAHGLRVSLVSSSVASAADQIAFWPNDDHPR